jgi:hypothetical protein
MARVSLDDQIDVACELASKWFRKQPPFKKRVNLGAVVGFHGPSVVSEADCALQFARFLSRAGVPWKDMHQEVSLSKWLVTAPADAPRLPRWRVDLGIIEHERFRTASLPLAPGERLFSAAFEFNKLDDYWMQPGGVNYGEPGRSRRAVAKDARKVCERYLETNLADSGWVIVFEQGRGTLDPAELAKLRKLHARLRVRVIQGYS